MRRLLRDPKILITLFIVALGFLVYASKLNSEFVEWDDISLIVDNPIARGLHPLNIWKAFTSYDPELYIPLAFLSYQLDYTIGGMHPFLFHLTNLLLHLLSAVLVSGIAFKLRKNWWIAGVTGLLFVVHPLHTEAVMWVSSRKDLLSAVFVLLSLWLYLSYRDSDRRLFYGFSLAFFFFALLSKVAVLTLPAVLLLIDWLQQRSIDRKALLEKAPYLSFSIIFLIVALYGKNSQAEHSSVFAMLLVGMKAMVMYLQNIFVPMKLAVLYPYTKPVTLVSSDFFVPMIILIALALAAVLTYKKSRAGIVVFFTAFLSIAPSFFNYRRGEGGDIYIGSDRYAYLASVAVFILVVSLLYTLRQRITKRIVDTGIALIICVFGFLAFRQADTWKDTYSLFTNVIAYYPNAVIAHHALGSMYQKQGMFQEAVTEYEKVIAVTPKASTYVNLAEIARTNGMMQEALKYYQSALSLDQENDEAYNGLGLLFLSAQQTTEAMNAFQTAVSYNPKNAEAHLNLGGTFLLLQRPDDAIREFEIVLALHPSLATASFNVGFAKEQEGNVEQAIEYYRQTIQSDPSFIEAYINLAVVLIKQGNVVEAKQYYLRALTIDPDNQAAIQGLAKIGSEN